MRRPIGLSILAICGFLGGLGTIIILVAFNPSISQALQMFGGVFQVSPFAAQLAMFLIAGICIASGVGMWLAKPWGWWLICFVIVCNIANAINALLVSLPFASFLDPQINMLIYIKTGGRIIVQSLVLLYVFNHDDYFGFPSSNRLKRLGMLIGVCGAYGAVIAILSLLTPQATSMSLNSDSAVKKPQPPELARGVDIINQSGAAAQPPVQPSARAVRRSPETRGPDFANVYWKKEYTLFDLVTDEPIFPVIKEGREVYQIYYSSNEDPRPKYGEFSPEDLETLLRYKFKTKESCMQFCNSRTKK